MTRLKDYQLEDQLYYTEMFVDESMEVLNKFNNEIEQKKTVSAESLMFNQLLKK